MILGVSGLYGAGKSAVVDFLRVRSFEALSLSDVLREELGSRGLRETREVMIALGRELRAVEGPEALARRLAPRLHTSRNYVIDSIRHPAEAELLRSAGQPFTLVWVEAPEDVRLGRIVARTRSGDPANLEDLRRLEGSELAAGDPGGQQLLAVRDIADVVIENGGSIDELHEAVRGVLRRSLYFERPGWDDYFMSIARVVSLRSNCVKRKIAAVVTLDRRIISTGYNGTPRGTRNCNEGGCPRCNEFAPSGTNLTECLCSHGEENAITQAAYHGVTLRGATLYTTHCPCLLCTKMMINAGIGEVVYNADYPLADVSLSLLREAGVKVRQIPLPKSPIL